MNFAGAAKFKPEKPECMVLAEKKKEELEAIALLEKFLSEELAEWDKKFTAKFGKVENI